MKLQHRLSLTISTIIVLMSAGFIVSLYLVERSHLRSEAGAARRAALAMFATVCRDSTLSRDEIGLLNYVSHTAFTPGIVSVEFVDGRDRIVMHNDLSLKGTALKERWPERIPPSEILETRAAGDSRGILEYAMPVEAEGIRLGAVRMTYDAEFEDRKISAALGQAVRRFAGVAALFLVAGVIIARYTAYVFVRPIEDLSAAVGRIGAGDFGLEIKNRRSDEIGRLSRDFNRMALRLRELDELKDQFIQTVSHDLRNPLFAIIAAADYMLTRKSESDRDAAMTKTISNSARDLSLMVTDILDVAKMKAGKMVYHRENVAARELIQGVCELYAAPTSFRELTLRQSVSEAATLNVDPRMVKRVFSNLIANAIKFTSAGGTIDVGVRPSDDPAMATFFVSDTGIGIPPEEQPKIFDRFHQISKVDGAVSNAAGTGLGLTISKSIVEDHGGKIWLESAVGRGTTFYFTLPTAAEAS